MSLRRTASGLESLHLFLKVDIVAFCEGGAMLGRDDIDRGVGDDGTADALFWATALGPISRAGFQVHVKSVGNKETLISILGDTNTRGLKKVFVCLDSDFDNFLGLLRTEKNAFYTFGYSWENDVTQYEILKKIFLDVVGDTQRSRARLAELERDLNTVDKEMADYTQVEVELHRRDRGSLFDRQNPSACLSFNAGRPTLNAIHLKAKMGESGFKRRPKIKMSLCAQHGLACSFGKLVAKYCYHLFLYHAKAVNNRLMMTPEVFVRLAISRFGERMIAAPQRVEAHFVEQCRRFA